MEWMEEYQVIVSTAFVASQRSREIKATDRHETVELGFVSVNHQSGAWGVICGDWRVGVLQGGGWWAVLLCVLARVPE